MITYATAQNTDSRSEQSLRLSFAGSPSVAFPLFTSANVVNPGAGVSVDGVVNLSRAPIALLGTFGFAGQGRISSDLLMLRPDVSIGAGLRLRLGSGILLTPYGAGGVTIGMLQLANGGFSAFVSPTIVGGVNLNLRLLPSISLFARGAFRYALSLYTGIDLAVGVAYSSGTFFDPLIRREKADAEPTLRPLEFQDPGLKIESILFEPVFPVFRKYYNDNPIGNAHLVSAHDELIESVSAELIVPEYMNVPQQLSVPTSIRPGERIPIDLYALLGENVLQVTEDTLTAVEITVAWTQNGRRISESYRQEIRFLNRNAMTWDDDEKACAFVTAKDPAVLAFAKNVSAATSIIAPSAVDKNLLKAMSLYLALTEYGMSYVIDPTSPYIERSGSQHQIDFLQFPRQSLQYRSGDCDDLSILYNALLESVGVETAFITIPGHIYLAVATKMSEADIVARFQRPDDFIVRDGKVWVPIEITELGGNFLKAWQIGAKQWREYSAAGKTAFYPIRDGWELYEPVGLPSTESFVSTPPDEAIRDALARQLSALAERELGDRIARLRNQIGRRNRDNRLFNSIGVLYARYGLYANARTEFESALGTGEYPPALINIANMEFIAERLESALDYYSRARSVDAKNVHAILGIAKVEYELENYGSSRRAYAELAALDPNLAETYAYLDLRGDEQARASNRFALKGVMEWIEHVDEID